MLTSEPSAILTEVTSSSGTGNQNFRIFGRTGPTGQRGPPLEVDHFDRFRLGRTVPFTFEPKFPEILAEWKAPLV